MKSGVGAGANSMERAVFELLSASQWWSATCDEYWRTAATAKFLGPKLQSCLEEMSSKDCASKEWLLQAFENIKAFRDGLRAGSFEEYEHAVFRKIASHIDVLTCCKSVQEAKATGYSCLVDPLEKGLALFSSWEGAPQMKAKLTSWVTNMSGEYAVDHFMTMLHQIQETQTIDWGSVSTTLKSLTGSLPSDAAGVFEMTKSALHLFYRDFLEKAGQFVGSRTPGLLDSRLYLLRIRL